MRSPQPDREYAAPDVLPVSLMMPELFTTEARDWLVPISVDGSPMAALVSLDVARAGFAAAGVDGVAGDLPSSITWPDLVAEARTRRVVYLTHQGRVAAAVLPVQWAEAGRRAVRAEHGEDG